MAISKSEVRSQILDSAQRFWIVLIEQKKAPGAIKRFEFTASSIIYADNNKMSFRVKRMFVFPMRIDVPYDNVSGLSGYVARSKVIPDREMERMITDVDLRKVYRKKAAILKWSFFVFVLSLIIIAATLIAIFAT